MENTFATYYTNEEKAIDSTITEVEDFSGSILRVGSKVITDIYSASNQNGAKAKVIGFIAVEPNYSNQFTSVEVVVKTFGKYSETSSRSLESVFAA